ncbi:MAG: DHA2 family efflux MFS transporter permease subunit [Caulobacteraceae bacterium]|nr:DHA2 family efflux MFS transporter permease subunit [Caulobacteraceae bacterium]
MTSAGALSARVLATAGMMLSMLMNVLDSTIANVALPHMQGSLSASQDQMTWVLTSYILGVAVMTPLSGWVSLKVGRKPLYLISIAAFVLVSMLCGVATNLGEMVFLRLLQGFAGAALLPLSQAIVLDLWPQSHLPAVMAIWSAVVMVAPVIGPTVGGLLTENYSWRWVFYINLPIGLVAFALVYFGLESDVGGRQRPFDFLGFTALVLFAGGAQLMVDRGPALDWFSSPEIWVEAIVALCGLYVFSVQTMTARDPFFDTSLFRDRNFMAAVSFQMAVSGVMYSTTALIPVMMQNLLGYSALQSGAASVPRGIGSLIGFVFAPWIASRINPRIIMFVGLVLTSAALFSMSRFDLSMTAAPIEATGFFLGIAQSIMFNPLTVLAYATLDPRHRVEGAVFSNMFRTIAGSFGIALVQAGLLRQNAVAHTALTSHISLADPVTRWAMPEIFHGSSASLVALDAEVSRQGSMLAYTSVFAWMSLGALALVPLILILKSGARPAAPVREAHID